MNKRSRELCFTILALVVLTGGFFALKPRVMPGSNAHPGPAGCQMRGSMGGPPGGPGGFEEMQKAHKYAFQLMRLAGSIGRLEESGRAPLTSAQAKSMLAVLNPLRERDSLDEAAAKDAVVALQDILTDKQRAVISALPAEHQFRRGGPPPGSPPQGQGPPPGPPPSGGPGSMAGFNPLNPPEGGAGGPQRPGGGPGGPQGPGGGLDKLFDDLRIKSGQ
jgi:hypothetical protein